MFHHEITLSNMTTTLMHDALVEKEEIIPIVSVVIHTYNQENYISKCIESVVSQDYFSKIKIIVIDDCSTDSTLNICRKFQKIYPKNIEIIALEKNEHSQGLFVGLSTYLRLESKYIAWCDGDDYWTDISKIRKQVSILEANPAIGIVHTDYIYLKQKENKFESVSRSKSEREKAKNYNNVRDLVSGNHVKQSTAVMILDAIDFNFVGAAPGIYARDWLILVSASRSYGIHYIQEPTTSVRVTKKGIWSGATHDTNRERKDSVRWYCADQLPASELRDAFRHKVVADWMRNLIAKSSIYKVARPFVSVARPLKIIVKKLIKSRLRSN